MKSLIGRASSIVRLIQAAIELERRGQLHEADDGAFVGGVAGDGFGGDRRGERLRGGVG